MLSAITVLINIMKKNILLLFSICIVLCTGCLEDDKKTETVDKEPNYAAEFKNFYIVIDDIWHKQDIGGPYIDGTVPYKTDLTKLVAFYDLSEGATATVNGVPQISSRTVNDFTNTVTYIVTSKDGKKQNTYTVDITNARNTESTLISLIIAGYTCDVNQTDKKVTLTVPFGTNLEYVTVNYEISENASFIFTGTTMINNSKSNYSLENDIVIQAENKTDKTTYTYEIVYE